MLGTNAVLSCKDLALHGFWYLMEAWLPTPCGYHRLCHLLAPNSHGLEENDTVATGNSKGLTQRSRADPSPCLPHTSWTVTQSTLQSLGPSHVQLVFTAVAQA